MTTVIFDAQPYIAMRAFVHSTAIIIGDVEIGENSSIWPNAILRGDAKAIRIGESTNIQDGAIVHGTHDSEFNPGGFVAKIGDEVTIGHNAVIHGCTIGNRCLIGIGAIVLDGAKIPSNVMIGAGSLVPANAELESGFLYVGSPVQKVRELTDEDLRSIAYSAESYVSLKNRYLTTIQRNRERERERERV